MDQFNQNDDRDALVNRDESAVREDPPAESAAGSDPQANAPDILEHSSGVSENTSDAPSGEPVRYSHPVPPPYGQPSQPPPSYGQPNQAGRSPYDPVYPQGTRDPQGTQYSPYHNNYGDGYNPYGSYMGYPPSQAARRRKRGGVTAFSVILSFFVVLFIGGLVYGLILSRQEAGNPPSGILQNPQAGATTQNPPAGGYAPVENPPNIDIVSVAPPEEEIVYDEYGRQVLSVAQIAKKVRPSVVGIVGRTGGMYGGSSLGSGIIMSEDGFILTNAHVVEGSESLTVILDDNREFEGKLLGKDAKSDIAIVKIETAGLQAAEFGDSGILEVGELAVAIGNPSSLDLAGTTTAGIISAVNRKLVVDENGNMLELIQTDAAINPGNSGGPLLNQYGQVIGINTVKLSSSVYEGLCFAIPTNVFKPIIDELLENGYVRGYPSIGINGGTVSAYQAQYYNVPLGVLVSSVHEKSDAAAKGMEAGDIITQVNREAVYSIADVNLIKNKFAVGDSLTLTVYRDGRTFDLEIRLMDEVDFK